MNGNGSFSVLKRNWAVDMPLYYLGIKPFCSPICATNRGREHEVQT